MNIKTFHAPSLQEALTKVYEAFGPGARVLHTRQVEHSAFLGLGKSHRIEVTASEAEPVIVGPDSLPNAVATVQKSKKTKPKKGGTSVLSPVKNFEERDPFFESLTHSPYVSPDSETIQFRTENKSRFSAQTERETSFNPGDNADEFLSQNSPTSLGAWRRMTAEQLNPTVLQRQLLTLFDEILRFPGPIEITPGKRKVVALVGPTGSGKTTTLVKIAAHYQLREFRKVGLVTSDMFRIAATDQMRKYAELLDIPLETVSEPSRLRMALHRLDGNDLILLDTPGLNPKNAAKMSWLREFLSAARVNEIQLVLSATSSTDVLRSAVEHFSALGVQTLTLSRLDEAVGLGNLYHFFKEHRSLPLRYFGLGQNISEDIEVAGAPRLCGIEIR